MHQDLEQLSVSDFIGARLGVSEAKSSLGDSDTGHRTARPSAPGYGDTREAESGGSLSCGGDGDLGRLPWKSTVGH